MTTLAEYFNTRKGTCETLRDNARKDFIKTSDDLTDALTRYDGLLSGFAALEKQVKTKRRALAAALMPADMEALAGELRDLLDRSRNARAGLLAGEELVAVLKGDQVQASDRLQRAEENLKEASREAVTAAKRQQRHDSWDDMVSEGVLSDPATEAAALLQEIETGGPIDPEDPLARKKETVARARSRIAADIPENLFTRALERGRGLKEYDATTAGLLDDLEDIAGAYRASVEGTSGKAAKLRIAFRRAEKSYRDLVLQSRPRYEQALALFTTIVESPALTDAERARITDSDLVSEGEAALAFEKTRDEAEAAVNAKKRELELAIAGARTTDMDADPEDNSDVQTARGELDTLKTALAAAEGNYTDDMRNNLDLWEASIPDHIWANAVSYQEAVSLLTAVRDGEPATLATAMENAESALVEALEEQDVALRTRNYLEDSIVSLSTRIEFRKNSRQQRLISAVRGD